MNTTAKTCEHFAYQAGLHRTYRCGRPAKFVNNGTYACGIHAAGLRRNGCNPTPLPAAGKATKKARDE